ncbi:MAG: peptidoglycan editing factor PgeF [Sulfurimonadaceae bacterium]|nr:peptidoglycan editing factor PgeF [Sulfurimonadaceae bacterium]
MLHSRLLSAFDDIVHAFTERSEGNIAFHVDDTADHVHDRQQELAERLGYERRHLIHMCQVHSDTIVAASDEHGYDMPPTCDATITDRPGQPLMVMVADCTPILLYDSETKVVAAVHAGRKGAFENIVGKSIERMVKDYGCEAKNIIAVLGPSIRACCYEVGKEINKEAEELGLEYAMQEQNGRYYLNVNAIILKQLESAGVSQAHTESLATCTSCENNRFFSYRADGQKTGRFAGVIMLKD